MKADLRYDTILHITAGGDTEIGLIPSDKKGVGIERLRFDGSKIVDLADYSEMWVEKKAGVFLLHAVMVPNSQLVQMSYADRKNLVDDADTFRLKTQAEITVKKRIQEINKANAKRRGLIETNDLAHHLLALVCYIVIYVRTQDKTIETFLDELTPLILDIYPLGNVKTPLEDFLSELKVFMAEYWQQTNE